MENRQLITRPENVPTFKSKELNTATKALYEVAENVYTTAMEGNKRICIILARVERTKAYKEDGFKSLVDYCGAIGFDKSKVHKMENAGRLYDSENETVKEFASSMGYGNLAVIASAPEEDIAKAVEAGELSSDSSQDDIREWKSTYNARSAGDKVLPKFEVDVKKSNGDTVHYDAIELENVTEIEGLQKVGMVKRGDNASPCAVYIDSVTLETIVIQYAKVKKEPKTKAPKTKAAKDLTKEDLIALAESMGMKITF